MFPLQYLKSYKFVSVILAFMLITILTGCNGFTGGEAGKVTIPVNNAIPIEGKWYVSNYSSNKETKYIFNYVEFSNKGVLFGNDFFENPNYKIKRVNAEEYFLYHLGIDNLQYKSKDGLINVVTVTCGNKYLYEFAVLNNYRLITKVEDNVLYLSKVSSKVDNKLKDESVKVKSSIVETLIDDKLKKQDSGILLGIKYIAGSEYNGTFIYGYKTIWISSKNGKISDVLEMNNILLPRKNGFYMITSDTKEGENNYEDQINIINLTDSKEISLLKKSNTVVSQNVSKSILYAGNDYISLDVTRGNKADSDYDSRLILEPVDNLSDNNGVKITDICGEEGLRRMNEARDTSVADGNAILEKNDITNFGIVRRAGHWYIKGRLSYESETEKKFKDYNINVMTPPKVIFYDTLFVPWTNVKDKIPDANDIFTSPNDNLAIVIAGSKLMAYDVNGSDLGGNPKFKINLGNYDSIVMAEWCTGNYVGYWEKSFKKQSYHVIYKN